jgi:hypothetical protein
MLVAGCAAGQPVPSTSAATSTIDSAGPSTASTPAGPATTDPVPPATQQVVVSGLDVHLDDVSLLAPGVVPGESSGQFFVHGGYLTDIVPASSGRYWVTPGGNVYTAFDMDLELVEVEMARLVSRLEGTHLPAGHVAALENYPRNDQLQLRLSDLYSLTAVGPVGSDLLDWQLWIAEREVAAGTEGASTYLDKALTCHRAATLFHSAAAAWNLAALRSGALSAVDWHLPLDDLYRDLEVELESATSGCDGVLGFGGLAETMHVEVSSDPRQPGRRVTWRYRPGAPEYSVLITIQMVDAEVGPPPSEPAPAPFLTMINTFTVATSNCGGLPWAYSTLAGGNSFTSPDDPTYGGPVLYQSSWPCSDWGNSE